MAKKKRNHKYSLIKAKRTYSVAQLAETLRIHTRTILSWIKQGLPIAGKDGNAYLVLGEDIKQFLINKRKMRKHPLQSGEFYCAKCQQPRKSLLDRLEVMITDKKLGKASKQAFIKGICEVCNTRLTLFSSDKKAQEWQEKAMLLLEHKEVLLGNVNSSYNTDKERG